MEINSLGFPFSHNPYVTLPVWGSVIVPCLVWPCGRRSEIPPLPEHMHQHLGLWCCQMELGCVPLLTHKFM